MYSIVKNPELLWSFQNVKYPKCKDLNDFFKPTFTYDINLKKIKISRIYKHKGFWTSKNP